MEHVFHSCNREGCQTCSGGLAYCTVCRGAEGDLLPTCPGYVLTEEASDLCYAGVIKSVDDLRPEHRKEAKA